MLADHRQGTTWRAARVSGEGGWHEERRRDKKKAGSFGHAEPYIPCWMWRRHESAFASNHHHTLAEQYSGSNDVSMYNIDTNTGVLTQIGTTGT